MARMTASLIFLDLVLHRRAGPGQVALGQRLVEPLGQRLRRGDDLQELGVVDQHAQL
jgi:hypothetical protein